MNRDLLFVTGPESSRKITPAGWWSITQLPMTGHAGVTGSAVAATAGAGGAAAFHASTSLGASARSSGGVGTTRGGSHRACRTYAPEPYVPSVA